MRVLSKMLREEGFLVSGEAIGDKWLTSEECINSSQTASSVVLGSRTDA